MTSPTLRNESGHAGGASAGTASSGRTAATERAYLARALWFEAHTARFLGIDGPTPVEVAAYALERRHEWAKSTWRQTKAALIFRYSAMGTAEAMIALDSLRDGDQSPCAVRTDRTSARRAKAVTPEALARVIAEVRRAKSEYAALLETWLLLGAEAGLRPHEWTRAEVIWARPHELGDVEAGAAAPEDNSQDQPQPYLRIKNGKRTNGRSHGEYRHLNLQRLNGAMVDMIGEFASLMCQAQADGLYDSYYGGCRKLLLRINVRLKLAKSDKLVQLYSPRHKFSSQAKKVLETEGVAALMGHKTTKTASEHYGRRSVKTGGSLGPRPVASEVLRVRKVRNARARRLAASPNIAHVDNQGTQIS
jgi:hypothetical protein